MTETLDPMDQSKIDHQKLAQQLLAQAKSEGVELVGPNGLLNQLTANVLETALEAEMDEHLGYEKHHVSRRGSRGGRHCGRRRRGGRIPRLRWRSCCGGRRGRRVRSVGGVWPRRWRSVSVRGWAVPRCWASGPRMCGSAASM